MIDYRRHNLEKIRYKPAFWKYLEDPDLFYGFNIKLSDDQYIMWDKIFQEFAEKNQTYSYNLSIRLLEKINKRQQHNPYSLLIYFARIKIAYHKTYHIRWNYENK